MIKSILGGKSKNLFDIDKFVDTSYVKRSGNSLICLGYGFPIGTLGSICPTLKSSDLITISFKCASEGFASDFMSCGGKIFKSGATFLVSDLGLSSTWYLYNTDGAHRDIPNKTTYSDIQVELGSTATEYVPHELTSYKSIMKVSDVCQLANSKLFTPMNGDTVSLYGVSITKNIEAGTITFNGTSTDKFWYHVHDWSSELRYTNLIKGYKYYISGMPVNDLGVVFQLTSLFKLQGEQIFTAPTTSNGTGSFDIYVPKGVTLTDFVVTPQLFNLTEMYRAGNEPKTVAEFKAKFPNDYYPYSPSCFVTSFDERMPCKTKNLFSSSTEVGVPSSTKFDRSEKRLLEDGKWYIGLTGSNYYSREAILDYSIMENSVYIKWRSNGYSLAKCIYCEPNTTYSVTKKYGLIQGQSLNADIGFYAEDGTPLSYTVNPTTFTTPENCKYITICMSGNKFPNDIFGAGCFSDLQLVKGTTATDYVPYGYV